MFSGDLLTLPVFYFFTGCQIVSIRDRGAKNKSLNQTVMFPDAVMREYSTYTNVKLQHDETKKEESDRSESDSTESSWFYSGQQAANVAVLHVHRFRPKAVRWGSVLVSLTPRRKHFLPPPLL